MKKGYPTSLLTILNGMKRCNRCGVNKTAESFRAVAKTCGIKSICIQCDREICRIYGTRHRGEIKKRELLNYMKNPISRLFVCAKHRSKKRGHEFSITKEYVQTLWLDAGGYCCLSGIKFDLRAAEGFSRNPFRPSLDRIDSNRGYVFGNVRIILAALNNALQEFGFENYLLIARSVVERYRAK